MLEFKIFLKQSQENLYDVTVNLEKYSLYALFFFSAFFFHRDYQGNAQHSILDYCEHWANELWMRF